MPRGKPYSSEFKAKVVIESLREDQTLNELAAKYNITSKLISNWRSQFLGSCKSVFESHPAEKKIKDLEESLKKQEELYIRQIGELAVEANWMKKKLRSLDSMTKAELLEDVSDLSIRKQASLLEINRSKIYYKKQEISFSKLSTMNQIDLIYTEYPIYGYRRIWQELLRRGVWIGRDRVLKYMQYMGIRGIFPGKKTSILNKKHKKYPYLLRDLEIKKPNQVWSMDITYIRVESGFCYLAAIIDWNSRYILSFKFSNTLSTDFCVEALEEALTEYPNPEIFNTDQGVQFTSEAFTKILLGKNIQISMDGKGRALDNIAIERFWRSLKYEDVYVNRYPSIKEAKEGIAKYIDFYNNTRLHSSLGYRTPLEAYAGVLNST